MQGTLSPNTAASIANRVYDIRKSNQFSKDFHADFTRNFKLTTNKIEGMTGGLVDRLLNRKTGFALTAEGRNAQFKGHHIIGIRGTHLPSASDWLTNANVGVTTGPKNIEVHMGFQRTFASIRPAFEQYIKVHKPKCLHCVGHSLGGALAQLTALWAREHGIPAKLYTFGAPRVVIEKYVPVAQTNIEHHRMIHGADPVPKVPIWPFSHTAGEYVLSMNNGSVFAPSTHSMEHSPGYVNTVLSYGSFSDMAHKFYAPNTQRVHFKYADRLQVNFSQYWQQRITDGLITFLKDNGLYVAIAAQASLGLGMTFYDALARSINGVVKASVAAEESIRGLLGCMLAFAGKKAQEIKELTVNFIRWVFELMVKALNRMAKQAIEMIS